MSEQIAAGLILAGSLLTFAGVAVFVWGRFGPRKPPPPPDLALFQSPPLTAVPSRTPFQPRPTGLADATPIPTPTPDPDAPWTFRGVDFADNKHPVTITFAVAALHPFRPYAWTPVSDTDGIFAVGSGNGLAWTDEDGRVGLWIHSGPGQTAGPLQDYLEREEHGYLRSFVETNKVLTGLIGTPVMLQQDGKPGFAMTNVAAAVRIQPLQVWRVVPHVEDLVSYLASRYPATGFEELTGRDDALLLYFCGLRLSGEQASADSYYRQARFIIALVPGTG